MGVTRITAAELSVSTSEILSRVCSEGESFVIERSGQSVAYLGPTQLERRSTWKDVEQALDNIPWPADEEFADEVQSVRDSQEMLGPPSWDK